MDRLEWQQEGDGPQERVAYDALGNVIGYVARSGLEIHHSYDGLGRRVGHAFTVSGMVTGAKPQKIARRFEYDDNYRLVSFTDAGGQRTCYRYDSLDRQTAVVYPDGSEANVEYDARGNISKVVDANKNEISSRYDAADRLIERHSRAGGTDLTTVDRFEYDGIDRLVGARGPKHTTRCSYDSLSCVLTEQQGDRVLRFAHDSAGNLTSLVYPGGQEAHTTYDIQNRVISVADRAGSAMASFSYRANGQIDRMLLGERLEAELRYDQQERLESLEYRDLDNQALVEGFRYQYGADWQRSLTKSD